MPLCAYCGTGFILPFLPTTNTGNPHGANALAVALNEALGLAFAWGAKPVTLTIVLATYGSFTRFASETTAGESGAPGIR